MGIDLLSASGHKIHGPKGVGLLYIADRVKLQPLIHGGGQQMNLRSGTDNVPGAAGMARAAELLYQHYDEDMKRLSGYKRYFCDGMRGLDGIRINGLLPGQPDGGGTAPHIVSVSVSGVRSEVLLHALEEEGIYVSAGSACAARKPQPSATLKAIGVKAPWLESTVRFSFSIYTTKEELDYTLRTLYGKIPVLRKYTRRA